MYKSNCPSKKCPNNARFSSVCGKMMILLLLNSVLGCTLILGAPVVEVPQGTVHGTHQKSYSGRTYSAFEGIPYAKPPVEDLRFAEPEPAGKWDGVLLANTTYTCLSYVPFPMMKGIWGSEDCLYLYVYVPREEINEKDNLDVVVHIHGGAFMLGAPKYMAGPPFIMDQDVVYVSLNYRLGILGFLSTEDEVVPGNNGLKDQSLALKWIKENIKYFGGNPESITLTGLSAGAASVHYHYLSPWSKGLFHRGFSQSGTALQHWALTEEPLSKAEVVAGHLNCTTESTKLMIDCLKKVPGKDLVMAILPLFVFMDTIPFTTFGPVVEKGNNPFLADQPYKLLQEGKVYDVPWVTSNVKEEGIFPAGFFLMLGTLSTLDTKWNEIMPYAIDINSTVDNADKIEVITKIRDYYLKKESLTDDNIYSLVQLFTDRSFVIDSEKAIRAHSKAVKSPVYYYLFSYLLEMPSIFRGMKKGVAHGDDGRLLFKIIGTPTKLSQNDEKMMKLVTGFIAAYSRTNIPSFNDVEWKPMNPENEEIDLLQIENLEDISMKRVKELAPTEFWNDLPIKENDKLL